MRARPIRDLFAARIRITALDKCWPWIGHRDDDGYGRLHTGNDTRLVASRIAYELFVGQIPEGMLVCHHCDNPPCCNPLHLFIGTVQDNIADRQKKGRQVRGLNHHWYTHPEGRLFGDRNPSRRHPESRPRGDNHASSKLTSEQVIEIRRRYRKGLAKSLALEFGVGRGRIYQLGKGQGWKHLKGA